MTITIEQIVAAVAFLGAVVMGLQRAGLLTFGRPVERRRTCDLCVEHKAMVTDREGIRKDINELKDSIERLEHDLTTRLDELSRLLHDHIGYCRGRVETNKPTRGKQ